MSTNVHGVNWMTVFIFWDKYLALHHATDIDRCSSASERMKRVSNSELVEQALTIHTHCPALCPVCLWWLDTLAGDEP